MGIDQAATNRRAGAVNTELLGRTFQKQTQGVRNWLNRVRRADVLNLGHRDLIRQPLQSADKIRQFLQLECDPAAMAAAVDQTLYRERTASPDEVTPTS